MTSVQPSSPPALADPVQGFMAALQSGAYYEDSAPVWAGLRQWASMVKLPLGGGIWVCTTWAGCSALARDARMSVAARIPRIGLTLPPEHRGEMKPFTALLAEMVLWLDAPRHTQVRKQLNRAFTPEVIARSRARIAELFDQLLDDWIASGKSEVMETLIHPFPALVIADWMGLPRTEWARFMKWADALIQLLQGTYTGLEIEAARKWLALVEENRAYLEAVVETRQPGGSDLFGLLMDMEEGEVLDRAQLVAQALIILLAGHETTRNLIGNGLHWLFSNSFDYREFLGDDLAQRLAVDEILRLSSPVLMMPRVVTDDFDFEGTPLKKGDYVMLAWASANRDPAQFPEPERMDLRRRNNPHLAFGAGPHACLGLHLARTEARIAFERLWSRLPNLRMVDPPPEWNPALSIHGPVRLNVAYDRER
jgi:pimeloyl-[acyl-carrier protein] synthase